MVIKRYSYPCTITSNELNLDENGRPIDGGSTRTFMADYQPNVRGLSISKSNESIPISFKLFIPTNNKDSSFDTTFDKTFRSNICIGDEISVDGVSGTLVYIYHTKLNTELWVK